MLAEVLLTPLEGHRVCYDQHGVAYQGDCVVEKLCAYDRVGHLQPDQRGFVDTVMVIGQWRGFFGKGTVIVIVCAYVGKAKESDSRRDIYLKHHPVRRPCLSR
jgi:hypothetical protein